VLIQSMEMDIAHVRLGGMLLTAVFVRQVSGVQIANLAAAVPMQSVRMAHLETELAFASPDGKELTVPMLFPVGEEETTVIP